MASQDQMKQLIEAIKKQPQWIFVGVLALILVARIFVFLNESSYMGESEAKPKIIELKPDLTRDSSEYKDVNSLLPPPPDERNSLDQSKYKSLVQTSVFDPDAVQAALSNRDQADKLVTDAYVALSKEDLESAANNAAESLRLVPNNRGALDLQRKIADKYVIAGYNELEKQADADFDVARQNAEKALSVIPDYKHALGLMDVIEKMSQPRAARNLTGSVPGTLPGMTLPGADASTTDTTEAQ